MPYPCSFCLCKTSDKDEDKDCIACGGRRELQATKLHLYARPQVPGLDNVFDLHSHRHVPCAFWASPPSMPIPPRPATDIWLKSSSYIAINARGH
eukprot:365214-Chlamydomonas_euryale.AAC.18